MSRGFVFVCWGKNFVSECRVAVSTIRRHSTLPCVLITACSTDVDDNIFDQIIFAQLKGSYADKILMRLSPFEDTVFLDTDVLMMDSFEEIFQSLNRFDILYQPTGGGYHYSLDNVPMAVLTEPSAGVIAWRKNKRTEEFFDLWEQQYAVQEAANGEDGAWDQRSMRAALWSCRAQIFPIPQEWQVYSWETAVVMGNVKLLHGRGKHLKPAERMINRSKEQRLYSGALEALFILHETATKDCLKLMISALRLMLVINARKFLNLTNIRKKPINKRRM